MKTLNTSSLLTRRVSFEKSPLSPTQIKSDALQSSFASGASDWRALTAMTFGGLAYRFTKLSFMSSSSLFIQKYAAPVIGLTSEVSVYRKTQSLLQASALSNEGFKSWFTDFVHFASLKSFGKFSAGQNLFFTHALQDAGMLAGHHLTYALDLSLKPEGTLAEQWIHAEMTNWQIRAGMSLGAIFGGRRFIQYEQGLEVRMKALAEKTKTSLIPKVSFTENLLWSEEKSKSWRNRTPEIYFSHIDEFKAKLRHHISQLIADTKLLNIEFNYEDYDARLEDQHGKTFNIKSEWVPSLRSEVSEILRNSSLQEIRISFLNGDRIIFFKHLHFEGRNRVETIEDLHVKHHESREFPDFESESKVAIRFIGPWKLPKTDRKIKFSSEIKRLRRKLEFTQETLAERLMEVSGAVHTASIISNHENDKSGIMPLATLSALAKIYRVDVRRLIIFSNLSRFPEISAAEWSTIPYPIYIEGQADIERLSYYRHHDPEHQSLGFKVYAARKNPWKVMNMVEIAENMGTSSNLFSRLELNENYPALVTLQSLAPVLGLSLNDLLLWAQRTYYPDLPVQNLFGNQGIHISANSRDREQIIYYASNPGSLGESMFVFRKTQKTFPSAEELSDQLGRHAGYWSDREWNRLPLELRKAKEWIHNFLQVGMPLEILMRHLQALGMHDEHPAYLLASAMGRKNREEVSELTGVSSNLLSDILTATSVADLPVVQADTILKLKEGLPTFKANLFYRLIHPDILEFFPEAAAGANLEITRKEIEEAAKFNLGRNLYAYRMDRAMTSTQMSEHLGVSHSSLQVYENLVCKIENPDVIFKIAHRLEISPKALYISMNPEVLRIFELKEPDTKESIPLTRKNYEEWIEQKAKQRDISNQRNDLRVHLQAQGINDLKTFTERFGFPKALAEKFWWQKTLTPEEISILAEKVPGISYQAWLEHFYGPELEYFLGRNEDGNIRYDLPKGKTWKSIDHLDLLPLIDRGLSKYFDSSQQAAAATGVGFLGTRDNLKRSLKGRAWRDDTLIRVARALHLDTRLLYMYFHYKDLSPIMQTPLLPE